MTSDPDQYAIPIYEFNAATPLRTVRLSGYFSSYDSGDNSRVGHGYAPTITGVPVPAAAAGGVGSDGQIVIWDAVAGIEYSFWQFEPDGGATVGVDLPEGTRLQLNPALTDSDFDRMGLSTPARVMARALQSYGMYVIDGGGSSKVFVEDRTTAHWSADINRTVLSPIPWSEFRVVAY